MNSYVFLAGAFAAVALGVTSVVGDGRDTCVARSPETAGQGVGYELIDLARREAWVTTDWTLDGFAAFSPGLTAMNWIKNDPRQVIAARARVLRSPGCEIDGEFTHQTMFGRSFFHIADITEFWADEFAHGALTEARVRKHHRLEFDAGQTVSFLVSPRGDSFVLVNRPVGASQTEEPLPEGWVLQAMTLTAPWNAGLIGDVAVLRLENGASYQGPIDPMPMPTTQGAVATAHQGDS
ncbi:MAG: hypothetical protein AAGP08_10365 [Pseudomonadota bacterium]